MGKTHHAWRICAVCTLLLFVTVGLTTTAFSIHLPYLISLGGLSNTQSSIVITIRITSALVAIFLGQRIYRRVGIRLSISIAAIVAASGFAIFGLASNAAAYYAGGIFSGFASGLGGMIPVSIVINRWFHHHRALALGICGAGTGLSAIIVPPAITAITEALSWQASFFVEMIVCITIGIITYVVLRDSPEALNMEPLNAKGAKTAASAPRPANNARISRGILIAMCIAVIMLGAIGNVSYAHLSVLFSSEGFSTSAISALLSLVGLSLIVGKCTYGAVTDKIGPFNSGALFFTLLFFGELLCCFAPLNSAAASASGMLLLGIGLSLSSVGIYAFADSLASDEQYGGTIKLFQIIYHLGALSFGLLPGLIADRFGSYIPFYALMVAFALLSGGIILYCLRIQRRNLISKQDGDTMTRRESYENI